MSHEEFYAAVAALLGTTHDFVQPPREGAKLRWGPRTPGNGRFPGHGLVRIFGDKIHVALTTPFLTGVFGSKDSALAAIGEAVK